MRTESFSDRGECPERNHPAIAIPNFQASDVFRLQSELLIGLDANLIGLTEFVEVIDVRGSQSRLHRPKDRIEWHTETFCFHSIDIDVDLRDA